MSVARSNNTVTFAGFVITFLGSVLFSTKAIIVKTAFNKTPIDALTLLVLRMSFSLPFFLVVAFFARRQDGVEPVTKKQWLYIIALGLFGYYLSSLFDFIGLQYISAGLERLILFLYPSFAVIINAVVFRQRITTIQAFALVLTYAGIGLAYWGEMNFDATNPNFLLGSFLIFLCAITYSIYIVGSGRLIPSVGAARFTALAMLTSTVGVYLHFIIAGNFSHLSDASGMWGYGLMLAILATVIPAFMLSEGMKRIGSNNVAIISSIGPVSTIIQAHFVLGEKILIEQVIGTVLVISGVLLTGWKRKPK